MTTTFLVLFSKSIKNYMQRQKKYILSCKIQEMFLFSHLCCATERPNIFSVAAGTHHWIVKTKNKKLQQNKNKTKKIIHQQLKQPYLYAHSNFFFSLLTKIANDVLKQNSRNSGVCYYGVK